MIGQTVSQVNVPFREALGAETRLSFFQIEGRLSSKTQAADPEKRS
jgi:hypothetical protein